MEYITPDAAARFAAIRVALAALGAYADGALLWQVGERHDDDDDEIALLNDEVPGYLLSLPNQVTSNE